MHSFSKSGVAGQTSLLFGRDIFDPDEHGGFVKPEIGHSILLSIESEVPKDHKSPWHGFNQGHGA